MNHAEKRIGETAVTLSVLLHGIFPVVTVLTYATLPPLHTAAIGTCLSVPLFASMLLINENWSLPTDLRVWASILGTSFINGFLYYALIFLALNTTSTGNVSILSLMEILFSYILLGLVLKHERLYLRSVIGSACMVIGAVLILFQNTNGFLFGDFMVIIATMVVPFGNMFAKQARAHASTELILLVRSVIGTCLLFLFASMFEEMPSVLMITESMFLLILNGAVLLGLSKILWLEGMSRIPITNAVSLTCLSPAITMFLSRIVLGSPITLLQIAGIAPILVGVYLLLRPSLSVQKDIL